MKILILGAKGSLGQTFTDVFRDYNVISWDRADLDIADPATVAKKISECHPDVVINCAAYTKVDKAEEQPELANLINGIAVGYISRICAEIGAITVNFSSAGVFDGKNIAGYSENDPTSPINAYAASKVLGEQQLLQNPRHYLIRSMWIYGLPSAMGKKSFLDQMLVKAGDPEIAVISDEFGQPTYVLDLALAVKRIIVEKKPFGVYHLANSGKASWYDWAVEIFQIKGMSPNLKTISRQEYKRAAPRPQYGILVNTKFDQLRPWQQALQDFLKTV